MAAPGGDLEKLVAQDVFMVNVQHTAHVRSLLTIVAGIAAGVLGLTSLLGFAFFLQVHVVTSLALLAKMKFDVAECLPGQTNAWLLVDGLGGQLMSFLLFWTVAYSVVNVY